MSVNLIMLHKGFGFLNWMLKYVRNRLVDRQLLFITDEAYSRLSGYVSSQKTRIWSDENPYAVQQIPLHSIKTPVWCAVSATRIIGPVFYHETMNSDWYISNIYILQPFSNRWRLAGIPSKMLGVFKGRR
jgi:hypothetical protein